MNWEYQVIKAETADTFQASLNKLGAEGWEAIAGTYTIGENKKISLGQGMPMSTAVGAPMWVAILKRAISTAELDSPAAPSLAEVPVPA